jgi:hypothetical protein
MVATGVEAAKMAGTTIEWVGGTGDITAAADWLPSGVPSLGYTYLIAAGAPYVDAATEQYQHDATFTLAGTSALGAPTLTLHDGADLVGTVLVGNASVPRFGTLEVQGSATLGTNSTTPGPVAAGAIAYGAAGTALDIVLDDGAAPAALTLAGDTTFIASGNLYNAGATVSISGALDASLVLDSGGLTVSNNSTLVVGVPISSPVNATGALQVNEGGVLELQSSVAVRDSAMLFGGLLRIDDAKHFAAHITQFKSGATLELVGVTAAPPADLPVDSQTKLAEMPLMNGVTLELPYQAYAVTQLDGDSFITVGASVPSNVGGAPGGGTAPIVTVTGVSVPAGAGDTTSGTGTGTGTGTGGTPGSTTSVVSITHTFDPCFVTGTQIAAEAGEVAVEALRPGMRVRTRAGMRPVVWVGRRRVDLRRHPDPAAVAPIGILAHAFGRGRPHRALWLSPDHAVLVAGALIPIRCLVNGATIAREDRAVVVYHHVELDRHDVLLAEGLPVESYLDTGNRSAFEGGAALTLHPDFAPKRWDVDACAPLLTGGPIVAGVRARLRARAETLGFRLTTDPGLRVCAGAQALSVGRDGYVLPRGVRRLRLHSRSVVPSEIDPAVQDRRRLGLALRGAWFDERVADAECFGTGFHAIDAEGPRWTTGDAVLHVPRGARRLRLGVDIWQRYWERSRRALDTPAATASVA